MNALRWGQKVKPGRLAAEIGVTPGHLRRLVQDDPAFPGLKKTAGGQMRFIWGKDLAAFVADRQANALPPPPKPVKRVGDLDQAVLLKMRRFADGELSKVRNYTPERARMVLNDLGGAATLEFLDQLRRRVASRSPR